MNAPQIGIRGIPPGFTGGSANLHEFSTVPAIYGGYDVWQSFAEFNLPLWESGPRRLELDLAGRYSDHSTSGGINSWKAGINLQVAESLLLRATRSRDVREPTFSERFDLQGGGSVEDPQNANAKNAITNVRSVFLNVDRAKVRGIDYEVLFNTELNWFRNQSESLSFRLLAGRLLEDSLTSGTAAGNPVTTDNTGQYYEPDFEVLATVRYQVGAFGVNLQQRYLSDSVLNVNWVQWEPGIQLANLNTITVDDNTVESQSITDLTFFYDAAVNRDAQWRVALAITNLFDTDPPVVADFGQRFSAQNPVIAPKNFAVYERRYLLSFNYRF